MTTSTSTIPVNLRQLAKMIGHSLLHPTMADADILEGLSCIKPCLIPLAKAELHGSDVLICPVIGFPHGNSTTQVKVFGTEAATAAGGSEIDMVINIGKAIGGDWG
ncbi:hypothetical protein jhhlp_007580 [Lomentospora prolificans]|uniref:Deoxyribose-phosphate aldolase n=1 Tax=Lomentospora prolificans TaxID=41688 RepID=A0A2N3MZZ0_9PEZI|nr:hypothetical protein jhhlp_007580 [Lomentospora prolificans]